MAPLTPTPFSAYDAAGNTLARSSPGVSVTPPIVPALSINSPTNGITLKVYGTVKYRSLRERHRIDLKSWRNGNTLQTCTNTTSCSATREGKKISQGTHSIGARAINNAGIQGSATVTIIPSPEVAHSAADSGTRPLFPFRVRGWGVGT